MSSGIDSSFRGKREDHFCRSRRDEKKAEEKGAASKIILIKSCGRQKYNAVSNSTVSMQLLTYVRVSGGFFSPLSKNSPMQISDV